MFRWIRSVVCAFALTASVCAQDAPSQESLSPVLVVQVLDKAGKPVPNATVGLYGIIDFGSSKGRGAVSEPSWHKTDAEGRATFMPSSDPLRCELAEHKREQFGRARRAYPTARRRSLLPVRGEPF